jgi:hypothetical protein
MNYLQDWSKILKDVLVQKESLVLEQLSDLVKRGLLVIEQSEPVLVQDLYADKLVLKQAVRLSLKDKEYIEKLEAENTALKEQLLKIQEAVTKTINVSEIETFNIG